MTYAELSEVQARRSRQFAEAQTNAMSMYCAAERDLKDLQAENAKLREQYETVLADYRSEVAKLRELVKSMYYDLTNMTFPPDWVTDYAADMRELELDVDE